MISFEELLGSLDGAAAARVRDWHAAHPNATIVATPPAEEWPFIHPLTLTLPSGPAIVWMPAMHAAFVNHQTANTRLVTTQPAYLLETWRGAAAYRSDVLFVGTSDAESLTGVRLDSSFVISFSDEDTSPDDSALLPRAFRSADPGERLALCVRALDEMRTPARLLAAASTCMEVNDLDAAARDLDEAITLASEWPAAHFERGKLWLRVDDMERASGSFRRAAELLPGFGSAWANLGATLGELDRPDEALDAFQHALQADPNSHQALNNIGVVNRELGRLTESEAAFRRVTELVPNLAFGYYNLGHTLFLQGRYQAALSAYIEGQRRDPERNPVQATRLAMCRLATGDSIGAVSDLQRATSILPRDYKQQLLADTNAIALALLTHRPDLPGWATVNDWLTRELTRR